MVLFLSNADVKQVLSMETCLNVLEEAYLDLAEGNLVNRPRIDLAATTDKEDHIYRWGTMEAVNARTGYHAIRMKSDIVYWAEHESGITEEKYARSPGTFCGLIFLFSSKNGEPLALIHDGYLTHMRVGAIAALGAKYLAREDAETVGMLGSGWMAQAHSRAFSHARNLRKIKVFSLTRQHRELFASEMAQELGIEVVAVERPEEAVRGADIVAACTDSVTPVVHGDWLEPGMHLTCVKPKGEWRADVEPQIDVAAGGDQPRPPLFGTTFRRGQGNFLTYGAGDPDLLERIPRWPDQPSKQATQQRQVPLGELVRGSAKGRLSDDEISASGGSGGGGASSTQGLPFVALGAKVWELASGIGLGHEIPTELLLQDIRD